MAKAIAQILQRRPAHSAVLPDIDGGIKSARFVEIRGLNDDFTGNKTVAFVLRPGSVLYDRAFLDHFAHRGIHRGHIALRRISTSPGIGIAARS
jgi:hypothetical protein